MSCAKLALHKPLSPVSSVGHLMTETPDEARIRSSHGWSAEWMPDKLDLVLVEGFKHEPVPKILLFRQNSGHRVEELAD